MGGVYLREEKMGEYRLAAKGHGIMSTPPLRVFLAHSLNIKYTIERHIFVNYIRNYVFSKIHIYEWEAFLFDVF